MSGKSRSSTIQVSMQIKKLCFLIMHKDYSIDLCEFKNNAV